VALHQHSLGLAQRAGLEEDLVGHAELADVMQPAGARNRPAAWLRETEGARRDARVVANLLEMASSARIDELRSAQERL
jgi:hypothetical protein